jgi:ATP-dependent helicase/nuclease subunit B
MTDFPPRPPRKGKIYTIAGSDSFAASLAVGVKAAHGDKSDPLALARVTLLVPTRRAVLAVRKAFTDLEPSGAVLMPQIQPLGDVGEDDLEEASPGFEDLRDGLRPVIAPLKRQLLLTQLIARRADVAGLQSVATAAALAADLIRFFDAVETENADLGKLDDVVPETLASHWQATLDFLKTVTEHWPGILDDLGVMDPVARRSAVLHQLADKWAVREPEGPVIIAGSTGSIPATQKLMGCVLAHETGALVLPGLDLDLNARIWDEVGETHPQFGLKVLLEGLGAERSEVASWPHAAPADPGLVARRAILSQAMLPADTTEGWLAFSQSSRVHETLGGAFASLSRIEADDPRLEALTIALIMRETMETPGKSVALVTPDRVLARRVSATLKRWDLGVDDSAGVPLSGTPVGSFLQGILDVVESDFAPVPLLGLLKHPLCGLRYSRPHLRALAARLEIVCLRGVRPGSGIEGVRHRLAGASLRRSGGEAALANLSELIDRIETSFDPVLTIIDDDPHGLIEAHVRVAESLANAQVDGAAVSGASRLWASPAGEAAMLFFSELLADIETLKALSVSDYPDLYRTLARPRTVRQTRNAHPRAFIWGPLEARLQSADRIILGGLNEKTWPQAAETDPWLSRPMRSALGMSQPERRIGQSAHDFVQLAGASDVILTRSLKDGGAQTVASRWLMRLENMLAGLDASELLESDTPWLAWARGLDMPEDYAPVSEPRPTPPVEARPRSLSVTEIETWLRDPYAIYARHVLGLRDLDPLDAPVGAATRGTVVHRALERFVAAHTEGVSGDDLDALIEEGRKAFEEEGVSAEVLAFWLPRFARLSRWFIDFEIEQRAEARPQGLEVKGKMIFDGPAGPFELKARADRIDLFTDGSAGLYDYKTGQVPSGAQVKALLAPQLPLEAMMVLAGGFEGIGKPQVREIAHLQVSGGKVPGRVIGHNKDIEDLAERASEALENFIATYDDPAMPYRSRILPMFEASEGSYDHLARVKEWSVYGAEDGGSE